MTNKTEEYLALACKTADSFSRQWEHWAEFLITAARLYKYSYPDQLMIYNNHLKERLTFLAQELEKITADLPVWG